MNEKIGTKEANIDIGKSALINSLLHYPGLAKTVSRRFCPRYMKQEIVDITMIPYF